MSLPLRHLPKQLPILGAMARIAGRTARSRLGLGAPAGPSPVGTDFRDTVAGPDDALVDDYLRASGGDPAVWAGTLPPHLFPQWGFPLLSKTLVGVPYDVSRVLNGGAKVEVNRPLPRGRPLHLRAELIEIDDDGSRAVFHQRLITGTTPDDDAVVAHVFGILPLKKRTGPKKPKPTVPEGLDPAEVWALAGDAGLAFALLTGDFNPIHWIPVAGKAAGFGGCILHGFATMARTWESLGRASTAHDAPDLASLEVRFVSPVKLPGSATWFHAPDDHAVYVGQRAGETAHMTGSYAWRS